MQYHFVEDLTVGNEFLRISRAPGLSAVVVKIYPKPGRQIAKHRQIALRALLEVADLAGRAAWLIAGDSWPTPETRITQYYRLWKGLHRHGAQFSNPDAVDNIKKLSAEGARYFGYRRVCFEDLAAVDHVLRSTQSFIALIRSDSELFSMIDGGWNSVKAGMAAAPDEAFERCLRNDVPIVIVLDSHPGSTVFGVLVAQKKTLAEFRKFWGKRTKIMLARQVVRSTKRRCSARVRKSGEAWRRKTLRVGPDGWNIPWPPEND